MKNIFSKLNHIGINNMIAGENFGKYSLYLTKDVMNLLKAQIIPIVVCLFVTDMINVGT